MKRFKDDLYYVGVNDYNIYLFESQFRVPNGISYNSYVLMDEKIAIFDSVDVHFQDEWLNNVLEVLNGRTPTYLIIQHMEPDHSSSINALLDRFPSLKLVGNNKTFDMLKKFYRKDYQNEMIVIKDKESLSLGKYNLTFYFAPFVHWPEVMMTYVDSLNALFSADAFGKFSTLDVDEKWEEEASRYYFGIVGKYGLQVNNLLKKLDGLDIKMICPLHGPILDNNLSYYLNLYKDWASYRPTKKGVVIAYNSIYGNTLKAVMTLKSYLEEENINVLTFDLAREDMSKAISSAFVYDRLVLACPTYNGTLFPHMYSYIHEISERNFQNRKVGIIENGSWGVIIARKIKELLSPLKGIEIIEPVVTILSSMSEDNEKQLKELSINLKGE